MTTAILPPNESLTLETADLLHVERTDINFHNVAPDRVLVEVSVQNLGAMHSAPTVVRLQAAPFGAFLPWRDVSKIAVPSIAPFSTVKVSTEIPMPADPPIGQFSDVPPRESWTALGSDEEPEQSRQTLFNRLPSYRATAAFWAKWRTLARWLSLSRLLPSASDSIFSPRSTSWGANTAVPTPYLARTAFWKERRTLANWPDLSQFLRPMADSMLSPRSTHWVGNINVLIGNHAVERHLAQALRIYPGVKNSAMFFVGERPDAYKFEVVGSGASWDVALHQTAGFHYDTQERDTSEIPQSEWIRMPGRQVVFLAVSPPEDCEQGKVDVHVRQRSTDREAVVEFSLDANAAGPGCYVA